MKGDVHCLCCPRRHHIPQNYGTEVKLVMMVFNASHGILRWSAYFALHFWSLRLKISRIGAVSYTHLFSK